MGEQYVNLLTATTATATDREQKKLYENWTRGVNKAINRYHSGGINFGVDSSSFYTLFLLPIAFL